ncbi:MAG: low specificity L-threonine aldolase [Burkholderiaceae bacterium]|jgi:threonine aldolase|nr:low specificity L-threonine aldolase [Burkholderiaceae bacterium]
MIDLFSDTKSKPTPAMRQAIANAEVGDEQKFEDPTTNRLRERICDLLGKEDAVFLPSGTMCNEIAIAVHCRPGDEVIAEAGSHIINYEGGGPAALAGVMLRAVTAAGGAIPGTFDGAAVRNAVRADNRYFPRTRLVSVEQTANSAGGRVWPLPMLREVLASAHGQGLATHMDGARLMNAVVASGVPARVQAHGFDSVWIDFSKGLGCPVGAMLAGSRDFIAQAWRLKQRWGGAMRQSGMLAAAALHALDHHVERLAEDHVNARLLAVSLAEIPGIHVDPASIETNIVFFDVAATGLQAPHIVGELAALGVQMGATSDRLIRAVTHLDISRQDVLTAVDAIRDVVLKVER